MADDKRKKLATADQLARRGKFARAADIYRELADLSPRDLNLRQRLADALARAGRGAEASKHFERIAETYWDAGHRSRAIATLKRALRIRANNSALHLRLGSWIMEHGHPADARQVLVEAAAMDFDAAAADGALETYELIARHLPEDAELHQAFFDVARRTGRPDAEALAAASLSRAFARTGRVDEGRESLVHALAVDADGLAALSRLPHLVEVVDATGPDPFLEQDADVGVGRPGGAILVAAWHGRHARMDEGARLLERVLASEGDWSPSALVYAAEVFTELERPIEACALLGRAETAGAATDLATRRRMVRVLHGVLGAEPDHRDAAALLERLTSQAAQATGEQARDEVQAPRPVRVPPPARRDRGGKDSTANLPPRVLQQIVEARSLLGHGLGDAASRALERIPSAYRVHPEIAELLEAVEVGSTGPVPPPASAPTAPQSRKPVESPPKRPPAAREEDIVVVMDGDDDLPPAAIASPEEELGAVIAAEGVEDDETRYQMAVGLLQMGLEDQAIQLFEECLDRPERRAEAAIELVRLRAGRGEVQGALDIGLGALSAPDLTLSLRGELLAEVAALAFHEGRSDLAKSSVDELDAIQPDHPALEGLRSRMAASEN